MFTKVKYQIFCAGVKKYLDGSAGLWYNVFLKGKYGFGNLQNNFLYWTLLYWQE